MDYGIVPLENSQAGSINEVYDLLLQHNVVVIGEILYPVNHYFLCLSGQQLGEIKQVISHPQALAQCDVFLRELGVKTVAIYNTAGSAKTIRDGQLQGVVAIASATAAQLYGLEVLVVLQKILSGENGASNYSTRIIILEKVRTFCIFY